MHDIGVWSRGGFFSIPMFSVCNKSTGKWIVVTQSLIEHPHRVCRVFLNPVIHNVLCKQE